MCMAMEHPELLRATAKILSPAKKSLKQQKMKLASILK